MRSVWISLATVAAVLVAYKILGRSRLARLDAWVERTLRAVAKLTFAVAQVFLVLLFLIACLFGTVGVAYSIDLFLALAVGPGAVSGCVTLLLVVPLSLYLAYHSLKLQAVLTLRSA